MSFVKLYIQILAFNILALFTGTISNLIILMLIIYQLNVDLLLVID